MRSEEITRKSVRSLVPELSELSSVGGYFVIDAGGGIRAGRLAALVPPLERRA